jgi:hypothetical protein
MNELNKLSIKALRSLAAEHGIKGRSKMAKAALIKALKGLSEDASRDSESSPSEPKPDSAVASVAGDSEPDLRHPYEEDKPLLPPLELGGIPVGYNREHLSLMVQDPTTLFSYWSVSRAEGDPIFKSGQAEVRLFDVTGQDEVMVRNEIVEPSAGRWFIHGLAPDRIYRAEFGVVRDGEFLARLKSANRQTPPDQPSRIEDDVFISIDVFQSLEDKAEDLRKDLSFRLVEAEPFAGATEHEHAVATRENAHENAEPFPLPLAEKPIYRGNLSSTSMGDMSSWPSSGVVSSWSSTPSSP